MADFFKKFEAVGQQEEASGDDSDELEDEGEAVVQHRNTISLENKQQFYNTFCDNLMGGCITTVAVQAAHGATIARTLHSATRDAAPSAPSEKTVGRKR